MDNSDSHNLERAVKEIDPEKATELTARYQAIMDVIDQDLTNSDNNIAVQSKRHLQKLANDVIYTSAVSDGTKAEDKKFMVDALDIELKNVAEALGVNLNQVESVNFAKYFPKLIEFFDGLHIAFPEKNYKSAYLNNLALSNVDIAILTKQFDGLRELSKDSAYFQSYLYANQDRLLTAVGQFFNGYPEKSIATINELQYEMSGMHDPVVFNSKTGLNLSDDQVQKVMGSLKANKMTDSDVFATFNNIKDEYKRDFSHINLQGDDFVLFLVGIALDYKGGEKKFVGLRILAESVFSVKERKENDKISEYTGRLNEVARDLEEYLNKNPDKLKDSYVLAAERNIATLKSNINLCRLQMFSVKVQRFLAMSYVEKNFKSTENPDYGKVIKDIGTKSSADSLRKVATKYNIDLPPDFGELERLDLDYQAAKIDLSLKDELNHLDPDSKKLYEKFYAEFAAGKLDTKAKKEVVLHQIYKESQALAKLSDDNERIINRDRVAIYGLIDRYGSISKVPEEERQGIRQKIEAYFGILAQGQSIAGKLLGTYINVELLDPKQTVGKDNVPLSKAIAEVRDFTHEVGGSMEDMAQFMEIKNFKVPEERELADSPLYMPILAKEVRPFNEKYVSAANKVLNSSCGLGAALTDLQKYGENPEFFEDKAIPSTRLFNHAFTAFGALENDVRNAQDTTRDVLGNLVDYKASVSGNKIDIVKKFPALKVPLLKIIDLSIKKANFLLNDPGSPISQKALRELLASKQMLKEAYDQHLNQVLYKIAAVAIITATAVAGGVIAAGYLSSLEVGGVGGFLLVTGGAAAGGTLGSRGGMLITNALNLSSFSSKDMWDPKNLSRDFAISWGMSLLAIGSARVVFSGLNRGAASKNLWIAGRSKAGLERFAFLQKAVAPAEWFGVSGGQVTKSFLKKYAIRIGHEYGEEVAETTLETVHPVVGFVASMINSADGMNVKLGMAGVSVNKVNAAIEGGHKVVYKTATAEEFVQGMEAYFAERGATSFNANIKGNGDVTITVADASGRIASLDVKPAKVGLDPAVEIRRINGIEFDQSTGKHKISNSANVLTAVSDLSARGFVLERTGNGLKAVKGSLEVEVEIDQSLQVEIGEKLQSFIDGINDLVKMSKEKPSPGLAASLRLRLASLSLSLVTLIPATAHAKSLAEGAKGIIGDFVGFILGSGLFLVDLAAPFYLLYRTISSKGPVFEGFPVLWKQLTAPGDLRTRIEARLNQYETRVGALPGDVAAREIGVRLRATVVENILDIRRDLNLLGLTDHFFTGANRTELEQHVLQLERSTNVIFAFLDGTRPWNQNLFDAEIARLQTIIPRLESTEVRDIKLKQKFSAWIWSLIIMIVYTVFRKGKNIKNLSYISTDGGSSDGESDGSGGYGKPPEGAPSGSSGAPSGAPGAPAGAPNGSGGDFAAPPVGPGSTLEDPNSENFLPNNLKNKGFYTRSDGVLCRKNYPGTYVLNSDGSIIYISPTGDKLKLPPNGDVASSWPKYTEPAGGTPGVVPSKTPPESPKVPDRDIIPSVEQPEI